LHEDAAFGHEGLLELGLQAGEQFFKGFWQTDGLPEYQSETILPTGVIELIFNFSDPVPFRREGQGSYACTPKCFVSGISDKPVQLDIQGQQVFFGVQLHPASVKNLLNIPAGEFLNAITDLEAISQTFSGLWQRLAAADCFHSRVHIMQQWSVQHTPDISAQEMAISDYSNSVQLALTVNAQAAIFCYSTRQLHRKMQA